MTAGANITNMGNKRLNPTAKGMAARIMPRMSRFQKCSLKTFRIFHDILLFAQNTGLYPKSV